MKPKTQFVQDLHEEETLNRVRFQLVTVERQVDRLAGHRSVDETAKLQVTIENLRKACASAKADADLLTSQVQLSESDLGLSLEMIIADPHDTSISPQ